jgi:hypothetical protein
VTGRGESEREKRSERKWEVAEDYVWGTRYYKHISGFQGSQAVPTHPSDRGNAYDQNYFYDV